MKSIDPEQPSPMRPQRAEPEGRPFADVEPEAGAELTLVQLANAALRNRRVLVAVPAALCLLVVVYTFFQSSTYTANSSFVPQSSEAAASQLAGLAAQFGVNLSGGDVAGSPEFYAELLGSGTILRETAQHVYAFVNADGERIRGDVMTIREVEGDTPEERLEAAVQWLSGVMQVDVSVNTGVVRLAVTTGSPQLAYLLSNELLNQVTRFNLETRQSQAGAQREFVEGQLVGAEASLREAEGELERFLQQNRRYENAPELVFEHSRLERTVLMRQQLQTTLAQALEQARIDEVRNTPVVTIVEEPIVPAKPDSKQLPLKLVLVAMLGVMAAVGIALARELGRNLRTTDPEGYEEFVELKEQTRQELRLPWRRASS